MPHMRAMVSVEPRAPLEDRSVVLPEPGPGQVVVRVRACGVCRTDLHVVDGELPGGKRPVIPGHQIVGTVVGGDLTSGVPAVGSRVGIPWLAWTCGACEACRAGRENLCDRARFTGFDLDGGFAEYAVADGRYCVPLPPDYPDEQAAPLLCAGAIGYRALRLAGPARRLGIYGIGAAAHLLIQVAVHQGREVYAFARPGDSDAAARARRLGAVWAGGSDEPPPEPLDAALIFAPVGSLVPAALRAVGKGGQVVCAGIHMSDIPAFPYRILWGERVVRSVANLTRADARELLELAPRVRLRPLVRTYPLREANHALDDLRNGRLEGAAVVVPDRGPLADEAEASSPGRS
jgi:propanol-preferring alcohol dehydrogenase